MWVIWKSLKLPHAFNDLPDCGETLSRQTRSAECNLADRGIAQSDERIKLALDTSGGGIVEEIACGHTEEVGKCFEMLLRWVVALALAQHVQIGGRDRR